MKKSRKKIRVAVKGWMKIKKPSTIYQQKRNQETRMKEKLKTRYKIKKRMNERGTKRKKKRIIKRRSLRY